MKATAGALSTAAINLASDITGILPVGNGGTGWTNIAGSAIPYGNGSGALATTTTGTGGYVLAYLNGVPAWTATTTFSAPLSYSGGAVSIPAASGSTDGYLSSGDWNAFNTKFATTSSDYWISQFGKGFFFSTTSANAWDAAQFRWSTTSTDYWKTANNFFSTTSADAWDVTKNRWATTSATYFESSQWRWSTSSSNYWETTQTRWATTSSAYFLSQNQGAAFSTTSANYLLNASTTIPRTTLTNTWSSLQTYTNGFLANASSTITSGLFTASGGASTTALTITGTAWFGTATTSLFYGAGLSTCQSNNVLTWANGAFGCEPGDTGSGGFAWTPTTNFGTTVNSTSTPILFTQGIHASSTSRIANITLDPSGYLNFGTTTGASGYGFRDNGGVLEFKNSSGTWNSINTATTGPSFLVNRNGSSQAIGGSVTKVDWTVKVFDTNSNFDLTNDRFQPTVPGKYIATAKVNCDTTTSICEVFIYKNGSSISANWTLGGGGNQTTAITTIAVDMNGSTDYLEAYAYNVSGTNISGQVDLTNFSGALIAPTAAVSGVWSISDVQFKENIATTTSGLDLLQRIPVKDFNLIGYADHRQQGFIAQELYQYYPEAVTVGGENAFQSPWLVDYGRLTPLVVRAVQELNLKLEDLTTTTQETSWHPDSFLFRFFIALKERLIAWFADAANGITDLFAKIGHFDEVHASKLCAGSTCVTETQLAALLSQSAASFANPSPASAPSFANPSPTTSAASGTPPVIMIAGNNPAHINIGDTYQDLGATAKDSEGHDLGVKTFLNGALVSDIVLDTSTTSTDTIDYVATDTWGNTATATRSVIIEPPAPPVTNSDPPPAVVPDAPPLAPDTATSASAPAASAAEIQLAPSASAIEPAAAPSDAAPVIE